MSNSDRSLGHLWTLSVIIYYSIRTFDRTPLQLFSVSVHIQLDGMTSTHIAESSNRHKYPVRDHQTHKFFLPVIWLVFTYRGAKKVWETQTKCTRYTWAKFWFETDDGSLKNVGSESLWPFLLGITPHPFLFNLFQRNVVSSEICTVYRYNICSMFGSYSFNAYSRVSNVCNIFVCMSNNYMNW